MSKLADAAQIILERRLALGCTNRGYGRYDCNSCGAQTHVDYDLMTIKREDCSTNCPFRRLQEALNDEGSTKK